MKYEYFLDRKLDIYNTILSFAQEDKTSLQIQQHMGLTKAAVNVHLLTMTKHEFLKITGKVKERKNNVNAYKATLEALNKEQIMRVFTGAGAMDSSVTAFNYVEVNLPTMPKFVQADYSKAITPKIDPNHYIKQSEMMRKERKTQKVAIGSMFELV